MIIKRIIYTFVFLICLTIGSAQAIQYGFIFGEKVYMRSAPTIHSTIIRQFDDGEFLIFLGKTDKQMNINGNEAYWYKVKTIDNKIGWVYGKFYFDLFENNEMNRLCKQIVDKVIVNEQIVSFARDNSNKKLYGLKFRKLTDSFYDFAYMYNPDVTKDVLGYITGGCRLYEYVNDKLYLRAYECSNLSVDKDYIFSYNNNAITAYERKEKDRMITPSNDCESRDECHMYKVADLVNSSEYKNKLVLYGNKLSFEPKTKTVVMQVKPKKNEPYITIHYKFENGKFKRIGEE